MKQIKPVSCRISSINIQDSGDLDLIVYYNWMAAGQCASVLTQKRQTCPSVANGKSGKTVSPPLAGKLEARVKELHIKTGKECVKAPKELQGF